VEVCASACDSNTLDINCYNGNIYVQALNDDGNYFSSNNII